MFVDNAADDDVDDDNDDVDDADEICLLMVMMGMTIMVAMILLSGSTLDRDLVTSSTYQYVDVGKVLVMGARSDARVGARSESLARQEQGGA